MKENLERHLHKMTQNITMNMKQVQSCLSVKIEKLNPRRVAESRPSVYTFSDVP